MLNANASQAGRHGVSLEIKDHLEGQCPLQMIQNGKYLADKLKPTDFYLGAGFAPSTFKVQIS